MNTRAAISIPADEYLARPHLVAWLAHPLNETLRDRAREAAIDWAKARVGQRPTVRADRVEAALRTAEKEVSRQFIAGEFFRLQLLDLENEKYCLPPIGDRPGSFSPTSLGRRVQSLKDSQPDGNWLRMDRENAQRDLWRKRLPALALAAAACDGLAEKPAIEALLFDTRAWALRAVGMAADMQARAEGLGHPNAAALLKFELATF